MRNITCLLDHHQRFHNDTIGPEGKFNWVLQLINSQKVRLFDSLEEKFNTKRSPNQPNQSQNQSVIDQGNLRARKVWLSLKVKRPVPMISMKKVFTINSVLQIDQGNLRSRLAWLKLVICLKIPVLSKLTMDRYDASQASSWLQASIVNFATARTLRRYSSSATMEKFFLILVELARILLAFFLWASITTKTDPALIDQGNLLKGDWDTYSRYDSQNSLGASLQFKIR